MAARSLSAGTKRVRTAIEIARDNAGISTGLEFYSDDTLIAMQKEARRARLLSREIGAWVSTRRATLVPVCAINLRSAHHIILTSELWMPVTTDAAYRLSDAVRQAGADLGIAALARWQPTRIGVNYMRGTRLKPAVIPPHTDPLDESGLVAVMQLSGESTSADNGKLQFILGADVCRQFDIVQPVHEVHSSEERTSLTIANLR